MRTFVAGGIVIHHIRLGRHNYQLRADKLFPDPYHGAAALGADLFLLRQLTDYLLVFQTFRQFFFGPFRFPGMGLHRGRFSRFRSRCVAADFRFIEEIQLLSIHILNLLTGLPKHPFAHLNQLFIQGLHLHQLFFQQLLLLLQLLFPLFQPLFLLLQ